MLFFEGRVVLVKDKMMFGSKDREWSLRTGKDRVKTEGAVLIKGSLLLDVILANEDQEEGTSLHLPALLDELQGILRAHRNTHLSIITSLFFGFKSQNEKWVYLKVFYNNITLTPFRSYLLAGLLIK